MRAHTRNPRAHAPVRTSAVGQSCDCRPPFAPWGSRASRSRSLRRSPAASVKLERCEQNRRSLDPVADLLFALRRHRLLPTPLVPTLTCPPLGLALLPTTGLSLPHLARRVQLNWAWLPRPACYAAQRAGVRGHLNCPRAPFYCSGSAASTAAQHAAASTFAAPAGGCSAKDDACTRARVHASA